ncbi:MAG: GNAT family N-acetyltransferase [Actinomycetota bacterium]
MTDLALPDPRTLLTECRIAPMSADDGPRLRTFCLAMIKEAFGFDYRPDWHADLDAMCEGEHDYDSDRRGAFLVARRQGVIVGCGALKRLEARPELAARFGDRYAEPDRIGSIWRVYIDPDHRCHGLGAELSARLEALAAGLGYDRLYLHTSANARRSVAFWEGCGYEPFLAEEGPDEVTLHLDKNVGPLELDG